MNHAKKFTFFILFFAILTSVLVNQRKAMDAPAPFFPSDAQIKYYQTVTYSMHGLNYIGCGWMGEDLDPHYKFYPFDHPWAHFPSETDCHFAYPQTLPWIGSIFYPFLGDSLIGLITIILLLISLIIIAYIFNLYKTNFLIAIIAILTVYFSSLSHTALNYSEITLGHFLLIASLMFYILGIFIKKEKNANVRRLIFGLASGFFLAWIPFTRPEASTIIACLFLGLVWKEWKDFDYLWNKWWQERKTWYLSWVGGILFIVIFYSSVNYMKYGHILGLRGLIVGEDFLFTDLAKRIQLIKNYIIGVDDQVGVLTTLPILLVAPLVFALIKDSISRVFIGSGFISFLLILVLTPYNADGLFASLRFFEGSYMILILGVAFSLNYTFLQNKKSPKTIFIFALLVIQLIIGFKYFKNSNKALRHISENQSIVYKKLHDSNIPLIHTSLFTAYLTGTYYMESPVFLAYSTEMLHELVGILKEKQINSLAVLYYSGEIPFNINFQESYKVKIYSRPSIPYELLELVDKTEIAGFFLEIYRIKK